MHVYGNNKTSKNIEKVLRQTRDEAVRQLLKIEPWVQQMDDGGRNRLQRKQKPLTKWGVISSVGPAFTIPSLEEARTGRPGISSTWLMTKRHGLLYKSRQRQFDGFF